jgi:glutamate formiminotransferase
MELLTVPNWSFGRDKDLLEIFNDLLDGWGLNIHFLESDVDHNRTVSAFSGEPELVFERLERLCEAAFERIDLQRHTGVHPRIGALDVCPFVVVKDGAYPLNQKIELFAQKLAGKFQIPIYLYEHSERGKHAADLPTLRKGGFGGLLGKTLDPDFGPPKCHPHLGVTAMGKRDFLIAMNVNFACEDLKFVRTLAKSIREERDLGNPRFAGVRAIGVPLTSRKIVQLSLNLSLPDFTAPDTIIEWAMAEGRKAGYAIKENELIGVIRRRDLDGATRLPIGRAQIVEL